jgi:hypothetical protein
MCTTVEKDKRTRHTASQGARQRSSLSLVPEVRTCGKLHACKTADYLSSWKSRHAEPQLPPPGWRGGHRGGRR